MASVRVKYRLHGISQNSGCATAGGQREDSPASAASMQAALHNGKTAKQQP